MEEKRRVASSWRSKEIFTEEEKRKKKQFWVLVGTFVKTCKGIGVD